MPAYSKYGATRRALLLAGSLICAKIGAAQQSGEQADGDWDFRRHIAPLINKLGCNTAACHGAAAGQAGLRLSLFGYDLKADHAALTSGYPAPRANWRDPVQSLLLKKPTGRVEHGGGELMAPGGWEEALLRDWIEDRAPGPVRGREWLDIERLAVEPAEVRFSQVGDRVQLSVVARWNDGASEDVTRFCRFVSRDPALARIDPQGKVTSAAAGAARLLVFYDRAIAPLEATTPHQRAMPQSELGEEEGASPIDRSIQERLARLRIDPALTCNDADYLRRLRLDLTGRLPTPNEVNEFLSDPSPDKRARLVAHLLESEAYVDHWTGWFCSLFGINEAVMPGGPLQREHAQMAYAWVRLRVAEDRPFQQMAGGLLAGVGRLPGTSFEDYCDAMSGYASDKAGWERFAQKETLPFFWGRTHIASATDKTLAFGHAFLGLRLQCAECHKHPFDRWTKDDFDGLKRFFESLRYGTPEADRARYEAMQESLSGGQSNADQAYAKAVRAGLTAPWKEVYLVASKTRPLRGVGGTQEGPPTTDLDRLADWVEETGSTRLSAMLMNRLWEHYFGTGVVDTPDDLSTGNPPLNRALLDAIIDLYDRNQGTLRAVHREIVLSDAYQRNASAVGPSATRRREFAQADFRRLPAEVLHDAVWQATAAEEELQETDRPAPWRAVGVNSVLRQSGPTARRLRPLGLGEGRAVCTRTNSTETTLRLVLELYNGPDLMKAIDRQNGWINSLMNQSDKLPPAESLVREAYLRTLSRNPTAAELDRAATVVQDAANPVTGLRDLTWALTNTREFVFQH